MTRISKLYLDLYLLILLSSSPCNFDIQALHLLAMKLPHDHSSLSLAGRGREVLSEDSNHALRYTLAPSIDLIVYNIQFSLLRFQQVPQLVDRYMAGDLPIEPYITHEFKGVESINDAMHVLRQSQCLRAVVTY
jgi:hypothetical protein